MSELYKDQIFWVETEKISPNPYQPRKEFNQSSLEDLADSVRQYGVMQPLTVTRIEQVMPEGGVSIRYELIAGERRLRASKIAGLNQVPVIIRKGGTDKEKLELAIIENLQREDLNAIDRAVAFDRLAREFSLSHAQIGRKMGKSREYVSNSLRLLKLPSAMQDAIKGRLITEGHSRPLMMLVGRPDQQEVLFQEIMYKKMSVREAERVARSIAKEKVRKKNIKPKDPKVEAFEDRFTKTLGTRVAIEKNRGQGGKIVIDYMTEKDLSALLEALATAPNKPKITSIHEIVKDQIAKQENLEASKELARKGGEAQVVEPVKDEVPGGKTLVVKPKLIEEKEEVISAEVKKVSPVLVEKRTPEAPSLTILKQDKAADLAIRPMAISLEKKEVPEIEIRKTLEIQEVAEHKNVSSYTEHKKQDFDKNSSSDDIKKPVKSEASHNDRGPYSDFKKAEKDQQEVKSMKPVGFYSGNTSAGKNNSQTRFFGNKNASTFKKPIHAFSERTPENVKSREDQVSFKSERESEREFGKKSLNVSTQKTTFIEKPKLHHEFSPVVQRPDLKKQLVKKPLEISSEDPQEKSFSRFEVKSPTHTRDPYRRPEIKQMKSLSSIIPPEKQGGFTSEKKEKSYSQFEKIPERNISESPPQRVETQTAPEAPKEVSVEIKPTIDISSIPRRSRDPFARRRSPSDLEAKTPTTFRRLNEIQAQKSKEYTETENERRFKDPESYAQKDDLDSFSL